MLSRREFGGGVAAGVAMRRGAPTHPVEKPPPANEPTLARVLRTRKLRVAGQLDDEPYCYKDAASGQWSGFYVAMAHNLAAQLAVEATFTETNWADIPTEMNSGKFDLTYAPSPTTQRAMFVDFVAPLFYDIYAIIGRKGFATKTWKELNVPRTVVAVDTGSTREDAAHRFVNSAAITGFKTREEALLAVQSGRADGFVATVFFALAQLKKNPDIGELVVPTPHLRSPAYPAVPYDEDRRFRGVVAAWSEDSRSTGQIRVWVMAALAKLGIKQDELPPDLSF